MGGALSVSMSILETMPGERYEANVSINLRPRELKFTASQHMTSELG